MNQLENSLECKYNQVPTKEVLKENEKEEVPQYGYGVRHVQLILVFMSLSVMFIARGHMGVTIVAMTSDIKSKNIEIRLEDFNKTNAGSDNYVTVTKLEFEDKQAPQLGNINETVESQAKNASSFSIFKTYNWSKPIQEMILSSFFVGYCIMMFPIGIVCQRWGGKLPLQIALLVNGVVSFVTPWVVVWGGWKSVCFCRILQGLSQAGTYPSVHTYLAKWVPANERGRLLSYVYMGTTVGTVIAFQLSGILAESAWGWPSTFWAIGVICIITFVILTIFGSRSPLEHKSISDDEKNFILGRIDDGIVVRRSTPWKAILTSKPLWATFATHAGSGSVFIFFFTQVPSFIHYTFGTNVRSSGLLSSLPYVASFFTSIGFGNASDFLTNRKILTLRNARRIFNSISQIGIALCLVCASFANSTAVAVACLVIAMGCHIGIHTGWMINHIDLAPNYTGTMMAIGNTLMNGVVLLIPVCVSNIVTDVKSSYQWRIMIALIAGLALVTNAIFVIFMSSDTQPWNDYQKHESSPEDLDMEIKEKKENNKKC